MRISRVSSGGFTRAEVTAIIAVFTLGFLVASPMHGKTAGKSTLTRCLLNMRLLANAWSLYAEDNNGTCVPNLHGGAHNGGRFITPVWATGWLDWTTSADNTNVALIRSPRYAALAPYLQSDQPVHKCPADTYLSRAQQARRWRDRTRTVVINASIGGVNSDTGPFDAIYAKVLKASDLLYPTPAETMVFFEEHPDSINDPSAFSPNRSNWIDLPASLHEGGATFAFADSHVELHGWRGSARNRPVKFQFLSPPVRAGDPDILWMRYHSARKTEKFD